MRAGLPVTDRDTIVSLSRAATIASFWNLGMSASRVARKRVPIQTPEQPEHRRAAAMARPSLMPPATDHRHRAAHLVHGLGQQRHRPDGRIVAPAVVALGHERIHAGIDELAGVAGLARHAHHLRAHGVGLGDEIGGRYAEPGHIDRHGVLEDDLELGGEEVLDEAGAPDGTGRHVEMLALEIGVTRRQHVGGHERRCRPGHPAALLRHPLQVLGHRRRQQGVDPERPIGERPRRGDPLVELGRCAGGGAEDAETAGVRDGSREGGTGAASIPARRIG